MRLSRPTQRLGGLEVDEQLDLGDLLHRQVDRLIGGDHQGTCPVVEQDANVASNSRSRWSVDPATTVAAGTASCRISNRFGVTSTLRLDMPVRLPRANSIGCTASQFGHHKRPSLGAYSRQNIWAKRLARSQITRLYRD
jgi:hypothetical protein